MDLYKYLNTIRELNLILEALDIKDVKKNIKSTKEKMDDLEARIDAYLNRQNLPFTEIRIEFLEPIKVSVRGGNEKYEIDIKSGRDNYDVVGFDSDFMVIRVKEWNKNIGLLLYYNTLGERVKQKSEYQLFYNKNGNLSGYDKTRSASLKDINFIIISKK
jgi:hypothetical protein